MNILKKAFTTSRDGLMPSVFSQLDSKMHGGGEAACHGKRSTTGDSSSNRTATTSM